MFNLINNHNNGILQTMLLLLPIMCEAPQLCSIQQTLCLKQIMPKHMFKWELPRHSSIPKVKLLVDK